MPSKTSAIAARMPMPQSIGPERSGATTAAAAERLVTKARASVIRSPAQRSRPLPHPRAAIPAPLMTAAPHAAIPTTRGTDAKPPSTAAPPQLTQAENSKQQDEYPKK